MRTLADIRSTFLSHFKNHDHEVVASSPLVPQNDPTLMFTNAGMVQFKDVFTGKETRDYKRAVTSQKCVRAGGKHNDLDNVGYTARHHTFFEMLGNFSFGDYFKEEAIVMAWDLLTKDFGLSKEKLLITVFHDDDDAFDLWKKITNFSDDKIIRISTTDNFWSMGDTGPCGPSSEIFYDHGEGIPGGVPGSENEDGDRFIEIWNLVFMQFEQQIDGLRTPLPHPSIDTGMGLERLAAILQGKHNNYETDLFNGLINATKDIIGGDGKIQSYNIIADHLRSCAFLIADGVMPSNEGRGYVLRRIMRRAMRHAHMLGAKDPLMYQMIPTLISLMGAAYPDLQRAESYIKQTLKVEEEKFRETLGKGLKLLEEEYTKHKSADVFPGKTAFKLYDTYGFPLDLTQDILRDRNIDVDTESFDIAMSEQKDRARAAWSGSGSEADENIYFDIKEQHGLSEFLGYKAVYAEGMATAIIKDGDLVDAAYAGDTVLFVTNQTPYYGESGGQVGDTGYGEALDESCRFSVTNTFKKIGDLIVHEATINEGTFRVYQPLRLIVDGERRNKITANHSATHLLHTALRQHLGDHVVQKGSLVDEHRLRFDFTHHGALTYEEKRAIENTINAQIRKNMPAKTKLMTPDDAIENGAIALFGENYGDEVRVVSLGDQFSIELCGGTHVKATGEIGALKIMSEGSVASGIRRIEAVTGNAVIEYANALDNDNQYLKDMNQQQALELNKKIDALTLQLQIVESQALENKITLKNIPFLIKNMRDVPAKDLRPIVDDAKKRLGTGVVVATTVNADKISIVIGVTNDMVDTVKATDLIKIATAHLGGSGGGGRPDMAQSGGTNAQNIETLIPVLEGAL